MRSVAVVLLVGLLTGLTSADVFNMGGTRNSVTGQWTGNASLEFVTVGDPGNAADARERRGAIGYVYQMGKYDVTASQYCQYLNTVAVSDPYGLYNTNMAPANNVPALHGGSPTFGITQSGISGSYSYSVTGNPNFPMNCISWGDAARFCNWLSNGQPAGAEGPGTTETGSYTLTGTDPLYNPDGTISNYASFMAAMSAVVRNPGATYVIPTENEWYKAAYYEHFGVDSVYYWQYPTRSDDKPSNVLSSTGISNANFWDNGYADPTNYLTPVGYFAGSVGPNGTFDMGGDVYQWDESVLSDWYRGVKGGSFDYNYRGLAISDHTCTSMTSEDYNVGFRVALVPEPATLSLLALGGLLLARRRKG